MYLGSDALALAPFTQRIAYLEENDWTLLRADGAAFFNRGQAVERPSKVTALSGAMVGKGNHRHFMMKEICEQPAVIGETLQSLVNPLTRQTSLPDLPVDWAPSTVSPSSVRTAFSRIGSKILVREAGSPAARGRYRLGVPLSGRTAAEGWRHLGGVPVRRDGGFACGDALRQKPGQQTIGHRQCAGKYHGA
jgi:hypothetical protein